MPIVLTPRDANHRRAAQRRQAQQRPRKIAPCKDGLALLPSTHDEHPRLAREKQTQVPQPRKAETRVAGREAPPAILQQMVPRLCAHLHPHKNVPGRARRRLAPREEVGPRAADGVLKDVGDERGQREGDEEPEDGHVVFVQAGAGDGRARRGAGVDGEDGIEGGGEKQGRDSRVEDVGEDGDALVLGVREGDGQVGDGEEPVEGGREGEEERIGYCKKGEAKVIWGVGPLRGGGVEGVVSWNLSAKWVGRRLEEAGYEEGCMYRPESCDS